MNLIHGFFVLHFIVKEENSQNEQREELNLAASERALVLDRIANNVAKRKSSMPQKFIGKSGSLPPLCLKKFVYFIKSGQIKLHPSLWYMNLKKCMVYMYDT